LNPIVDAAAKPNITDFHAGYVRRFLQKLAARSTELPCVCEMESGYYYLLAEEIL
jgi:hypothetical protein